MIFFDELDALVPKRMGCVHELRMGGGASHKYNFNDNSRVRP